MKRILVYLLVVGVIIVALFMNPKELYHSYKTEKEIKGLAPIFFELAKDEFDESFDFDKDFYNESIEVEYIGGNLFQLKTRDINIIIKRHRNKHSSDYEIYVKHEEEFTRFDGLKKNLF
ncbi:MULTISPECIES: hypothetical protein [Bacillus]|uniref:hypothetical protein n=1 Tax=Bacillus TaxID=1386 RepID=UPI000BB6AB41|nr:MULTISPECIES: hypothetical protein [Bacillus]